MNLYIDFGGTNFRYILDGNFETLNSKEIDLVEFIEFKLLSYPNIGFIGISFAGQVQDGVITSAPNIDTLENFDIKSYFEDRFDVTLEIENDLKCAALAEFNLRADAKSIAVLYIGTGFGSAYIEDGKLIRGVDNLAGEIGHIPYREAPFKCGCKKSNCLELFCSGGAIKRWIEHYNLDIEPTLDALKSLDTKISDKIVCNFMDSLLLSVSTIVTILNPNYLILGGGVIDRNRDLISHIKDNIKEYAFANSLKNLKIELSSLKDGSLEGTKFLKKENYDFVL